MRLSFKIFAVVAVLLVLAYFLVRGGIVEAIVTALLAGVFATHGRGSGGNDNRDSDITIEATAGHIEETVSELRRKAEVGSGVVEAVSGRVGEVEDNLEASRRQLGLVLDAIDSVEEKDK